MMMERKKVKRIRYFIRGRAAAPDFNKPAYFFASASIQIAAAGPPQ